MSQREDELYTQLVQAGVDEAAPPAALRKRVLRASCEAFAADEAARPSRAGLMAGLLAVAHSRKFRYGPVAAAVGAVILGGVAVWSPPSDSHTGNGQWWLGPSAAWGQEILAELEKVRVLTYREQPVFVGRYGSTHVSGSWRRAYEAADRKRIDQHYEQTLVSSSWQVPDGTDLVGTAVSYESECYTVERHVGGAYERDPLERLRFYVHLLDKADRVLGTETFEDRECVGFEIRASRYGDNPEQWKDRIWLDIETKMPVRIEEHGRPITNHPEQTFTEILEQFEYHTEVPAAMFEPVIPDGFVNAHPDEIRAARERAEKGEMIWADVPKGLKGEVIAALDEVRTAVYWRGTQKVSLSRHAWRADHYGPSGQVRRTEWFTIAKEDMGATSFDFNDKDFRLTHTTVDFADRTFERVTHGKASRPRHPMDRIRRLAGLIDRADRTLDNKEIDGLKCFGMEISAKKYGTNPDGALHRLWFDAESKLPVRMETEWPRPDGKGKSLSGLGRFDWDPNLPPDTFVPVIPEGFMNAHPDDRRSGEDTAEKGE